MAIHLRSNFAALIFKKRNLDAIRWPSDSLIRISTEFPLSKSLHEILSKETFGIEHEDVGDLSIFNRDPSCS